VTAAQRAARSARLRRLLGDDDIKDALASVEADLLQAWRGCHDAAQRETLWHTLNAYDRLRSRLMTWSQSDIAALARKR